MLDDELKDCFADNLRLFMKDVMAVLGEASVITQDFHLESQVDNVTSYRRNVSALVYAKSVADIQLVITYANHYKIPLYPISQGKNWGLGSRTPVSENNVILDLSAMNKIIEVNTTFGYAVIEPGVTQKQLADYLEVHNIPYFLDVTGSGCDTSVMGNTLERGVAYNSMRVESFLGFEAIAGSGEILNSGYGHNKNAKVKNLYKHGIGPDFSGLFFQSNFGIVINLTIKLTPVMPCRKIFLFSLKEEKNLIPALEKIKHLRSYNLFQSIIHLANKKRSEITIAPLIKNFCSENNIIISNEEIRLLLNKQLKGSWSGIGSLMGTKKQVRVAQAELKKHLSPLARVRIFDLEKIDKILRVLKFLNFKKNYIFLSAIKPLLGLTVGKPTNAALHSVPWSNNEALPKNNNPDHTNAGFIFCLPLIPLNSNEITEALGVIHKTIAQFIESPAITLNVLNEFVVEAVININFNKSNASETEKAHKCIQQLNHNLIASGYYPYRMDINNIDRVFQEDSHWATIAKLKSLFDPQNILAPGRYVKI